MNQKAIRFNQPDPDIIPAEIAALGDIISTFAYPEQKQLSACYQKIVKFSQRRIEILNMLTDSLSQMRLDSKLLLFDLDITREERDRAIAQLEEREW
ncbi:transcriptional regulator [Gimesia algae]|uniref:Uncharacterized protein n=1 Tax=Gimesia algae TaxID=2527971 RepID=A0A517VFU0_9PLAN|nr:transcriptional regulator [Gimesia algae]QDT91880.1 hypothetical protein Pan161_35440 [Gimesia algae]